MLMNLAYASGWPLRPTSDFIDIKLWRNGQIAGGWGTIWREGGELVEMLGSKPPALQAARRPPKTQTTNENLKGEYSNTNIIG